MALSASDYIADFDSAAAMVRANSRFLNDRANAGLGMMPRWLSLVLSPFARGINMLPQKLREQIYTWNGWSEAIRPRRLRDVDSDAIRSWVVDQYPRRQYPAIFIGSSGGAAIHLACALGVPWLPQTALIPVRRHGVHPDEPRQDVGWGLEHAHRLLEDNPDIQLHHMHDPNQDRLMIQHMSYFRVKLRTLGEPYESFIDDCLAPGGTIYIVDNQLQWPTTKLAERYYFQHGALGGATVEEFHDGGARVEQYLDNYDSHRRQWNAPQPDAERPEAEWGFEPRLTDDIHRVAQKHDYGVRRIAMERPDDLSPLVADLYRWWYRQRNLVANRLVAESFVLMDPWSMLRTGSVPYWMVFNKEPSAQRLDDYLQDRTPFDDIGLMLFSHGTESIGLVPIDRWKEISERARRRGFFIGVDEEAYPRDFATFVRYHTDLDDQIRARYPMPGPLHARQLDRFLEDYGDNYRVQWTVEQPSSGDRFQAAQSDRYRRHRPS